MGLTARPAGHGRFTRPEPLQPDHDRSAFDSATPILDEWFREAAWPSEGLSARTYVVREGAFVVGYYCIASSALLRADMPGSAKSRRGLPEPVPMVLIGRLAVDRRCRGMGIGAGLLRDAIRRCFGLSRALGVRGVIVHALDDAAAAFYRKFGFIECRRAVTATPLAAGEPRTMFLPIESARAAMLP